MLWLSFLKKFDILRACLEKNKHLHRENRLLRKMLRDQEILLHEQQQLMEMELNSLREASLTDPLTGLFNRRYLEQNGASLFSAQERNEKFLAVIFIDLDGFKPVNDACGHDAGDELLAKIAIALEDTVRRSDIVIRNGESNVVARIGGDEFLIVATNITAKESLLVLSDRLHKIAAKIKVDSCDEIVSFSIGICFVGKKPDGRIIHNLNEAIGLADQAMYIAKKSGKSRTVLIESEEDLERLES